MHAFIRAALISGLLTMAEVPPGHAQATKEDSVIGLWAYRGRTIALSGSIGISDRCRGGMKFAAPAGTSKSGLLHQPAGAAMFSATRRLTVVRVYE